MCVCGARKENKYAISKRYMRKEKKTCTHTNTFTDPNMNLNGCNVVVVSGEKWLFFLRLHTIQMESPSTSSNYTINFISTTLFVLHFFFCLSRPSRARSVQSDILSVYVPFIMDPQQKSRIKYI